MMLSIILHTGTPPDPLARYSAVMALPELFTVEPVK
jgi:hypothetical protein